MAKNKANLTRKQITDKKGKRTAVWVKTGESKKKYVPKLSDYSKEVQDKYNEHLEYYGQGMASRYLDRQPRPKEHQSDLTKQHKVLVDALQRAKERAFKKIKKEKLGTEKYNPVMNTMKRDELKKQGLTEKEIKPLTDVTHKSKMKTIWDENNYLYELLKKKSNG